MPTYEYGCPKCGHTQDEFHWMNANPEIKCNECGEIMKRQVAPGAGIVFKGTGFYSTDYRHKAEHSKHVKDIVNKVRKGDDKTMSDIVGNAPDKVKKAHEKQQKTTKNTKNLPVRRVS